MSVGATANAANLLVNAGFETGDLSGWTVGGNTPSGYGVGIDGQALPGGYYAPSAVEVRSGNYAVWAETANAYGEVLTLSQTLTLAAGTYSTGFWYGSNQGPFGNFVSIRFNGSTIASGGPNINQGFQLESANFVVASAGTYTLQYNLSGSGTAAVAISADDFYLNSVSPPVPEPETYAMMMAGLGLLGALARRRKTDRH